MMRRRVARIAMAVVAGSIALASGFPAAAGVIAAEPPPGPEMIADSQSPSELAREGTAKLLEAFDRFLDSVPRYELPQFNENGDIILRRQRPESVPDKTFEPAASHAI